MKSDLGVIATAIERYLDLYRVTYGDMGLFKEYIGVVQELCCKVISGHVGFTYWVRGNLHS